MASRVDLLQAASSSPARGEVFLQRLCANEARRSRAALALESMGDLALVAQLYGVSRALGALVAQPALSQSLVFWAVFIFVCAGVKIFFQHQAAQTAFVLGQNVRKEARGALFSALARLHPLDRNRPLSGDIATRVSDTVEALAPFASRYRLARGKALATPALLLLVLLAYSWFAALLLVLLLPLAPLAMALVGLRARKASERQMRQLSDMSAFFLDRLRGLPTLRLLGATAATETAVKSAADEFRGHTMRILRIAFLSSGILELLFVASLVGVATFVGAHWSGWIGFGLWRLPLDVAPGLFMIILVPEIFRPLREFSAAYHDRASALAAAGQIAELIEAPDTPLPLPITEPAGNVPPFAFATLQARELALSYPGTHKEILSGVSFTLKAGETVALTGASGSGKTTLLAALYGLLSPERGEILVDGAPLEGATLQAWRAGCLWLGQSPHIFHGSVRANLRLADENADDEALYAALATARLDAVVRRMPRGLATPLGEGGHGLSGGEARRLAFARALLRPGISVLLVDEPTADLDRDTARDVLAALLNVTHACKATLVIATHDPEAIALMQRIFELPAGKERESTR